MRPLQCPVCSKIYERRCHLTVHLRRHNKDRAEERKHTCHVCDKTFGSKTLLAIHMRIHTGKILHKCTVCDMTFSLKSLLARHKRIHHIPTEDQLLFASETNNRQVIATMRPLQCPVCSKIYERRCHLTVHLRRHNKDRAGERKHTCHICDKTFGSKTLLAIHMRIHTGKNLHKCTVCDMTFSLKSLLARHERIHHIPTEDQLLFRCRICSKSFAEKLSLKKHSLLHKNKRGQSCDVCGKFYSYPARLARHRRAHNVETTARVYDKDKPCTCAVCGKTFTQKCNLDIHALVHTGQRPYACTMCDKSFSQKGAVKRHMVVHTGERLFSCTECGKAFTDKESLGRHHIAFQHVKHVKCDMKFTDGHSAGNRDGVGVKEQQIPDGKLVNKKGGVKKNGVGVKEKQIPDETLVSKKMKKENTKKRIIQANGKRRMCALCDEVFTDTRILARHMQIHVWENDSHI